MARLNQPGGGADTQRVERRSRLTRNSELFTRSDQHTQSDDSVAIDPYTKYAEQERAILDELPEDEEEEASQIPDTFNLAALIHESDVDSHMNDDGTKDTSRKDFAVDWTDTQGRSGTYRIPLEQLQSLDATQLHEHVKSQPQAISYALRKLEADHRQAILDGAALFDANELNKKKFEEVFTELQHTAKSEHELRQEADTWYNNTKAAEKEVDALKDKVKELDSLVPDDTAPTATDIAGLQQTIQKLKQDLEDAKRGRPAEKPKERSARELSLSRRRRGDKPADNPEKPTEEAEKESAPSKERKERSNPYDSDSSDSSSSDSDSDSESDYDARPQRKSKSKGKSKKKGEDEDFEVIPLDSVDVVRYDPTMTEDFKTNSRVDMPKPKFSGENYGKDSPSLDEWTIQVGNKFSVSVFKDVPSALRFLQECTTGLAQQMLRNHIPQKIVFGRQTTSKQFTSVRKALKFLNKNFGDYDPEGTARNNMDALKMNDSDKFSVFYAKYQKERARLPPATSRKQEAQELKKKLSFKYRNRLVGLPEFKTAESLAAQCYRLESEMAQLDIDLPRKVNDNKDNKKPPGKPSGAAPGATPPTVGQVTPPAIPADVNAPLGRSPHTNQALLPWKDRPEQYKNLAPLTQDQRTQIIASGGCLRCRGTGHASGAAGCPLDPYERPKRKTANNGMTAAAAPPAENA